MLDTKLYIEQLIKRLREDGIFELSSEDYICEDVFRAALKKFIDKNIRFGLALPLTDNQLNIILEESKIKTVKNTINFLSEQNILEATGIDRGTGEFIYTLTAHGKSVYRKIFMS